MATVSETPIFSDIAIGRIATAIDNGDDQIQLESGQGARFPTPQAGEYAPAIIRDRANDTFEEIEITGRVGDLLDVRRGVSVAAAEWSAGVEVYVTATAAEYALLASGARVPTPLSFTLGASDDFTVSAGGSAAFTVDGGTGKTSLEELASGLRLQDFSRDAARIVRNEFARDDLDLDEWTVFTSGDGSGGVASDSQSADLDSGASGGAAFLATSFAFEAGQVYCVSARFAGTAGAVSQPCVSVTGGPESGENSATVTSDGRVCIRFAFDTAGTRTIRIGIASNNGTEAGGVTRTVSEVMLEKLDSISAPPSEYTPPSLPSAFSHHNGNTVSANLITEADGNALSVDESRTALILGDSFSNGQSDIPFRDAITDSLWSVVANADGGRRLSTGAGLVAGSHALTALTQYIGAKEINPTFVPDTLPARYVVALLSVNDIASGDDLATVQAAAQSFAASCRSLPVSVTCVLSTCPPFGNSASYSAAKEAVRVAYNTWVKEYARDNADVRVVDVATVLEDPATTTDLLAAYDSGDGLHPNESGMDAVAAALIGELERFHSTSLDLSSDGVTGFSLRRDPSSGDFAIRIENGTGGREGVRLSASGDLLVSSDSGSALAVDGDTGLTTLASLHVNAGSANNAAIFESTDALVSIQLRDSNATGQLYYTGSVDLLWTPSSWRCDKGMQVSVANNGDAMIDYNQAPAASATGSVSSLTAGNSVQGFIRIEVAGTDYWMPYYNAPTS